MEDALCKTRLTDSTIFVPLNKAVESTLAYFNMSMDFALTKEVATEIVNYHIAQNTEVYAYNVTQGPFLYTRSYWAE